MKALATSGKDMWDESIHYVNDFDKLADMNQFLAQFVSDRTSYDITKKKIMQLKVLNKSPYFGRFDFQEEDFDEADKIYVGTSTLTDSRTNEIIIYDWRAPISGMFYRCELGKGSYISPKGLISGDILKKRQYKIVNSELKYFFDSSITINDEILQEVLSQNASSKMKSIVETIQKEQDVIIRDTENELLIVQGVAGSGKTSIALHRIAFLLYEGLSYKLNTNDIIIISPNLAFSNYISNVLPELGEDNVDQLTPEEVFAKYLPANLKRESRQEQLERIILKQGQKEAESVQKTIEFKGSAEFVQILDRFIRYYEKNIIKFKDIYYDGRVMEKRELLRDFFLNDKINMPIVKRLERIEGMIFNKIIPLQKERRAKLLEVVRKCNNHPFDMKEYSRYMAIQEARRLKEYIRNFSIQDYTKLYELLFNNKDLFLQVSKGIKLPEEIDLILKGTSERLKEGYLSYEDCAPLLYLKIKLEGNDIFSEVKQTVIDEAQDYNSMDYQVFKLLFKDAKFTVLGDFNQCIEKSGSEGIYDDVIRILDKRNTVKLTINKGYRSSYEISAFNRKILGKSLDITAFERHDQEPLLKRMENREQINHEIIRDYQNLKEQGYESIALVCKSMREAEEILKDIKDKIPCKIIDDRDGDFKKELTIMPAYLSKGLEFDCVLIYDASEINYSTELDRRLLYIACTRPLHRLSVYYTENLSRFLI
jgi:DNA helicase-2/ATP-dependent DNA helicase PcrA